MIDNFVITTLVSLINMHDQYDKSIALYNYLFLFRNMTSQDLLIIIL